MGNITHGEVDGHIRRCEIHGGHGIFYPCKEYSKETLAAIEKARQEYVSNLRSLSWCNKQITDNNVPAGVIAIFRGLAGIDNNDEIT